MTRAGCAEAGNRDGMFLGATRGAQLLFSEKLMFSEIDQGWTKATKHFFLKPLDTNL